MPISPNVKETIEDLLLTGDCIITDTNGHIISESAAIHDNLKNEFAFVYPISFEKVPEKIIGINGENFDGLTPTHVIYGENEDTPLYFVWK